MFSERILSVVEESSINIAKSDLIDILDIMTVTIFYFYYNDILLYENVVSDWLSKMINW